MSQPSDSQEGSGGNMAGLRAQARSAYQKQRIEATLRAQRALALEDQRNAARGAMPSAAAMDTSKLDVAQRLAMAASASESGIITEEVLASLPSDLQAIARERYRIGGGGGATTSADSLGSSNKRSADSDEATRGAGPNQPSAERPSLYEVGLQAVGDEPGATKRSVKLLVDDAAIASHINEAREQTKQESGGPSPAAAATPSHYDKSFAVNAAKRKLIELQRAELPVTKAREEILKAVKENQVVVIIGETGSGKTTQIPQFLLEAGYKKVACTQPRRLAAMSVAERVANEMGVRLGGRVGYNVRFDNKTSDRTEIEFVTDGMMMKTIMGEPDLASYGAIMIDEAHERSVSTDILLGFLRDLIRSRSDLRIVVASATIEANKFAQFFGKAPLVRVSGRTFPVQTMYLPEPEEDFVLAAATAAIQTHLDQPLPGDILIFMPGQEDIERCISIINESIQGMEQGSVRPVVVLPVYSSLPQEEQNRIYAPAPANTRKIIVSTNIAETSITVDGIVYVIDTGLCKQNFFSSATNMQRLAVVPISVASAEQRKGRAGRTRPGQCLRLYTKWMYENELEKEPVPEILRTSLTSILLNLKTLGIDNPLAFDFIDAPSPDTLCKALDNLLLLGALTRRGKLTKTGRRMAELPVEPSLGKALLKSQEDGCAKEMCIAAAMLSLQNSVFVNAKDKASAIESAKREHFANTTGDVAGYYNLFNEWERGQRRSTQWCTSNGINANALARAYDVRNQLISNMASLFAEELTSETDFRRVGTAITKCMLAGYFMNVAKLSVDDRTFIVPKTHVEAFIHPGSVLSKLMFIDRRKFEETQRNIARGIPVPPADHVPRYLNVVHGAPPSLVLFAELRNLKERAYMVHVSAVTAEWVRDVVPDYFSATDLENILTRRK